MIDDAPDRPVPTPAPLPRHGRRTAGHTHAAGPRGVRTPSRASGGPGMPAPDRAPCRWSTRPRWPWVLGAVAAVVVVLGLLGSVLAPSTTVSGTVTVLREQLPARSGSSCYGRGPLQRPAARAVRDWSTTRPGSQVGQGALGHGHRRSARPATPRTATAMPAGSTTASPGSRPRIPTAWSSGQRNGVVFTSAQAEGHADISVGTLNGRCSSTCFRVRHVHPSGVSRRSR